MSKADSRPSIYPQILDKQFGGIGIYLFKEIPFINKREVILIRTTAQTNLHMVSESGLALMDFFKTLVLTKPIHDEKIIASRGGFPE